MLIWINGAFGAGKTQTAYELHRRLGRGHVADPELLGFALHKMLPEPLRNDFQDLPQWRAAVQETLLQIDNSHGGPTIVPMSIVRQNYFDEIIGGLRRAGVEVKHYTLTATPDVLRGRLRRRSAYPVGRLLGREETWAMSQIDRCVAELAADQYATHVPTDNRALSEVVELLARDAGLTLPSPPLPFLRSQLRRLTIEVRHIRF